MIVPAFPELNIYSYSRSAGSVPSLGAVTVATVASKLNGWDVEIIDENNYVGGPVDKNGLPDHVALQIEKPADAVGFYCGLTSTIERVWQLARFYRGAGVKTIAGGWHAHYCPAETLAHNIDLVVHGEGEPAIQTILTNVAKGMPLESGVTGCSFILEGSVRHNSQTAAYALQIPDMDDRLGMLRNEVRDLDSLPYPDFGLMRFAKLEVYPVSRIRGCGMKCEFCSVNRTPAWSTPAYFFGMIKWLDETRGAKKFFIVDDRTEEDMPGTIEFFEMIERKYGSRLKFFVQTRLGIAKNTEFLQTMKAAGVRTLFIGCESPIDEDLKEMNKGYTSKHMLSWVKILRRLFWVHGMFIFGYPPKEKKPGLSALEMFRRFWRFISNAGFDSIQVLKPILLPGTKLRARIEAEGRVLPQSLVPWSRYDGNSVSFIPDNMTPRELQEFPMKLMAKFYHPLSLIRVAIRTFIFPVDFFVRGWRRWHTGWYRDIVKFVGSLIVKKWTEKYKKSNFLEEVERYCAQKKIS